jgi:hypothetical protein
MGEAEKIGQGQRLPVNVQEAEMLEISKAFVR